MTKFKKYIENELLKINDYEHQKSDKKVQKVKEMGVDDLINYINQEDNKPKKNKKKNNRKSKKTNDKSSIIYSKDRIDSEIEEFKNNLQKSTVPAFSVRKIKPNITLEWLSDLAKSVL